jgi:hypothetical protein
MPCRQMVAAAAVQTQKGSQEQEEQLQERTQEVTSIIEWATIATVGTVLCSTSAPPTQGGEGGGHVAGCSLYTACTLA